MGRPKNSKEQTIAAFWKRVDRRGPDECWNWVGWIQKLPKASGGGYGKFATSRFTTCLPHRFVYELAHGPIPKGMLVCHKCDNRACCNPAHLFCGTHKDNTMDCIKKGRFLKGERHPSAKLTDLQVSEIRMRYTPRKGVAKLATEFGVHPAHIWAIANQKFHKAKEAQLEI